MTMTKMGYEEDMKRNGMESEEMGYGIGYGWDFGTFNR